MPMPTPEEIEAERAREAARQAAFQQRWTTRPSDLCEKVLLYCPKDDRQCQVSAGEEDAWLKRGYIVETVATRAARKVEREKAAAEREAKAAADAAKVAKPPKPAP